MLVIKFNNGSFLTEYGTSITLSEARIFKSARSAARVLADLPEGKMVEIEKSAGIAELGPLAEAIRQSGKHRTEVATARED